jgi:hypothetical protein
LPNALLTAMSREIPALGSSHHTCGNGSAVCRRAAASRRSSSPVSLARTVSPRRRPFEPTFLSSVAPAIFVAGVFARGYAAPWNTDDARLGLLTVSNLTYSTYIISSNYSLSMP